MHIEIVLGATCLLLGVVIVLILTKSKKTEEDIVRLKKDIKTLVHHQNRIETGNYPNESHHRISSWRDLFTFSTSYVPANESSAPKKRRAKKPAKKQPKQTNRKKAGANKRRKA